MFDQENLMNGKTAGGGGERSEPQPAAERGAGRVEVLAKPVRRRFTADYKRRIVAEAERFHGKGESGALLRREGLYASQLAAWRKLYRDGGLQALSDDKRGRKRKERNPLEPELRKLQQENRRLQKKLMQADLLIDLQKKVAAIMAMSEEELQREDLS